MHVLLTLWPVAALAFALGLLFGSFANVLITRLPAHESIVLPGSHCRSCGTAIRPVHNIPLLSWIFLRGRCATCRAAIPWRYPAVELAAAILFCLAAWRFGATAAWLHAAVLSLLCIVLFVTDLEMMRLPDAVTLPGIAAGMLLTSLSAGSGFHARALLNAALGALTGAALILCIRYGYRLVRGRHGMGLGDAKLLAIVGAFLGWAGVLLTFALAVLAAALAGIVLLARSRRNLAAALPFGSFLCAAAVIALFWRSAILTWYGSLP